MSDVKMCPFCGENLVSNLQKGKSTEKNIVYKAVCLGLGCHKAMIIIHQVSMTNFFAELERQVK
jgi:hypothetical protein